MRRDADASQTHREDAQATAPGSDDAGADVADADVGGDVRGDVGGAPASPPATIIRGAPGGDFHDLIVHATGLSRWEGKLVIGRIGDPSRPPERLATARAFITAGELTLRFPGVLEDDLYKRKAFFIDADASESCSAGDAVFTDHRATRGALMLMPNGETSWSTSTGCADVAEPWPSE